MDSIIKGVILSLALLAGCAHAPAVEPPPQPVQQQCAIPEAVQIVCTYYRDNGRLGMYCVDRHGNDYKVMTPEVT